MPSLAATKYKQSAARAKFLRDTATNKRLGSIPEIQTQVYYHSALAAYVAAWEAYIEDIVREFFDIVANPLDSKFDAMHSINRNIAEKSLKAFNTPNAEKSRELILQFTGYDPLNDWNWTTRGMGAVATRELLNDILKIRHSFAHGFAIPAISWIQTSSGKIRLTARAIDDVNALFNFLISMTDKGMKQHIQTIYGVTTSW